MIYESQKLVLLALICALLWFLRTVNTGRHGVPAPPFPLYKIAVGKREGVDEKRNTK